MSFAPRYPIKTWECGVCGHENPGDLGYCVGRCRGGAIMPYGGLLAGEEPYEPMWHALQAGFKVQEGGLRA